MKVLIIGSGSIAKRHQKALRKLKQSVEFYALRSQFGANRIPGLINLYDYADIPDDITFIIISNPTSLHHKTLKEVLQLKKPVFLEKPPFMCLEGIPDTLDMVKEIGISVYTAFNMRFHPVIQWAKKNIRPDEVLEIQSYCGSYLPDWRPQIDYQKNYSATAELGGGVHLDLIHELDYLHYLFGLPKAVHRFLSKVSDLEINSVDHAHYWLEYEKFGASVLLNYFRKTPKRTLEIVTCQSSITLDLLTSQISDSSGEIFFSAARDPQYTYDEQMKYYLNHLNSDKPMMNTLEEAIETLKICIAPNER